jgi:hypothetical protein
VTDPAPDPAAPRRPSAPRRIDGPHVPPADLTAFSHGEFPEWRRAEVSRHLLRCPACRAEAEGARDVLGRLASLGAAGDAWRDDLAAAGAALRLLRRRSGLAVGAGAAAAAVLAAGLLFVRAPERPVPTAHTAGTHTAGARTSSADASPAAGEAAAVPARPGVRVPRAPDDAGLSPDEKRLLATQRPDGRWRADEGAEVAASDEAATGLSLLALAARRPDALREGPVARAAASAVSWLLGRRRAESGALALAGPEDAHVRDRAISTAALLEVWSATREPGLYPAVDAAVRDVARRAPQALADVDARWSRAALARAQTLGWDHLEAPLRRIPAVPRVSSDAESEPWPVAAAPGPSDLGPLACALRVLAPSTP